MSTAVEMFAITFIAFYVGHHVGDYWVQTDTQARRKGEAGPAGRLHCLAHVLSYVATQNVVFALASFLLPEGGTAQSWALVAAYAVSGVTHYMADRREHGLMFRLARLIPGKSAFLTLGVPRSHASAVVDEGSVCSSHDRSGPCWDCQGIGKEIVVLTDNPQLATGAWALDQSWHLFFGVFVPALIMGAAA